MNNNYTPLRKTSAKALLQVENLSWSIAHRDILQDIHFALPEGSFTGIIGPNGAGKSSLLRCLYRYLQPSQGQVRFNNQCIWQFEPKEYAKQVAVVLQETPSQFQLSVTDVIRMGLIPHQSLWHIESFSEKQQIVLALEQVGLINKAKMNFDHLSGGEQQRVMIARAIVQQPKLLIMDEPTSHLDVKYQIEIMQLAKSLGITVVASFHDLNLASAVSDQLLVLKQGQLVAKGQPSEVITQQLLHSVFDVQAQVNEGVYPHIIYQYEQNHQQSELQSAFNSHDSTTKEGENEY